MKSGLPIEPGPNVRIIATSGPVREQDFQAGIACLEDWGFEPRYDKDLLQRADRYCAGDVEQRTAELLVALNELDTDIIWAARGGYGAMQLLEHINPNLVRKANKLLIGFSDLTALHLLWRQAGVLSIHGPNVTSLAGSDQASVAYLHRMLTGDGLPDELVGSGGSGVQVTGALTGGNLALLASLCGTDYNLGAQDNILFLEEIDERPYRIDRMLTQLRLANWLSTVRGVILGDFSGCDPTAADGRGYAGYKVAAEFFKSLAIPVAWGFPFGHDSRRHSLLYGAQARLEPESARLRYL